MILQILNESSVFYSLKLVIKMKKIRNKLYKFILNQNIKIDEDTFSYGSLIAIKYFIYLLIIIPISIIFHNFLEFLIFIITFVSLRRNVGGIHLNNTILCMLFSIFFSFIIPFVSKFLGFIDVVYRIIISLFSLISINFIGIIDHKNKRITKHEREYFLQKANKILLCYFVLLIFSLYTIHFTIF